MSEAPRVVARKQLRCATARCSVTFDGASGQKLRHEDDGSHTVIHPKPRKKT